MKPTPHHLPIVTMVLLAGGMGVVISKDLFTVPVGKVLLTVGMAVFLVGMVVALAGMIWSICTLTNSAQRIMHGITTPVVTILIAAFAWSGALVTVYKYKESSDERTEEKANIAAKALKRVKRLVAWRASAVKQGAQEQTAPMTSNSPANEIIYGNTF